MTNAAQAENSIARILATIWNERAFPDMLICTMALVVGAWLIIWAEPNLVRLLPAWAWGSVLTVEGLMGIVATAERWPRLLVVAYLIGGAPSAYIAGVLIFRHDPHPVGCVEAVMVWATLVRLARIPRGK